MTVRELSRFLDLAENELICLEGKWVAYHYSKKTEDSPTLIIDEDGRIIADENLICVQEKISQLNPDMSSSAIKKQLRFKHITKNFDYLEK